MLLFAIALTLLMAERRGRLNTSSIISMMTLGAILIVAYSLQKAGAHLVIPSMTTSVGWVGDAWIGF